MKTKIFTSLSDISKAILSKTFTDGEFFIYQEDNSYNSKPQLFKITQFSFNTEKENVAITLLNKNAALIIASLLNGLNSKLIKKGKGPLDLRTEKSV